MSILDKLDARHRRTINRFAPAMLVVIGLGLFIFGFAITNTGESEPLAVTQNPAIEELIPAPGAEVLRQSRVGIDLAPGYTAEFVIDGTPIPLDQVNIFRDVDDPDVSAASAGTFDDTLNRFEFQPLEGRAIEELKADENCVVADFWRIATPEDREQVRWCFTVA